MAPLQPWLPVFVHIPRTGGTSIRSALGLHDTPRQHLTAAALRRRGEFLEGRFSFTIVRNPWDRLASIFRFLYRRQRGLLERDVFRCWIDHGMSYPDGRSPIACAGTDDAIHLAAPQVRWLDGEQLDFIARFERLQDDFAEVCRRAGIAAELPHVNAAPRPAAALYDAELVDRVRALYRDDVALTGASGPTG